MKLLMLCLSVAVMVPGLASGVTLDWDRNSETDMQDYLVYRCVTAGCVVEQLAPIGTVVQTAVGVRPLFIFDGAGQVGAVAVSARDTGLNESPLSPSVPFDATAVPPVPKLRFKWWNK